MFYVYGTWTTFFSGLFFFWPVVVSVLFWSYINLHLSPINWHLVHAGCIESTLVVSEFHMAKSFFLSLRCDSHSNIQDFSKLAKNIENILLFQPII